jgi:tyrosyl-tRNA synthetase
MSLQPETDITKETAFMHYRLSAKAATEIITGRGLRQTEELVDIYSMLDQTKDMPDVIDIHALKPQNRAELADIVENIQKYHSKNDIEKFAREVIANAIAPTARGYTIAIEKYDGKSDFHSIVQRAVVTLDRLRQIQAIVDPILTDATRNHISKELAALQKTCVEIGGAMLSTEAERPMGFAQNV